LIGPCFIDRPFFRCYFTFLSFFFSTFNPPPPTPSSVARFWFSVHNLQGRLFCCCIRWVMRLPGENQDVWYVCFCLRLAYASFSPPLRVFRSLCLSARQDLLPSCCLSTCFSCAPTPQFEPQIHKVFPFLDPGFAFDPGVVPPPYFPVLTSLWSMASCLLYLVFPLLCLNLFFNVRIIRVGLRAVFFLFCLGF